MHPNYELPQNGYTILCSLGSRVNELFGSVNNTVPAKRRREQVAGYICILT